MSIETRTTIHCDGVLCREGEDCDGFTSRAEAESWARAEGWTVGKRVLCPRHQTPEAMRELRAEEAERVRILSRMEADAPTGG